MIIIGVFPHKRLRIVNDWYYYWILLDQDTRERYTARIERIRESFGLQVFYQNVTREEKDIIVKAMGLAQGHWFKCPKGENYCQSPLVLVNKVFPLDYKGRLYQIIFPIHKSLRASLKHSQCNFLNLGTRKKIVQSKPFLKTKILKFLETDQ